MINRRALMTAAAAASVACSRGTAVKEALVSIVPAGYDDRLYGTIPRILRDHRIDVRGKKVVLKPNLVEFDSGTVINTNPLVVHAALEAFRAAGAADVRIAEGPGHRRITFDMADAAGYFSRIAKFEDLFTDLNTDEVTKVALGSTHSPLRQLHLPNTVLGCDLLVSLPKMKTHHWVGATLSMKNFFGCVPGGIYGWPKNVLHWSGINECIVDLYNTFPSTFTIVDGIDCMEGNGPIQGTRKHVGILVAGRHLPSVDATCCRVMGIDPFKVEYLRMVASRAPLEEASVRQIAEPIEAFRTKFELPPEFGWIAASKKA